MQKNIQNIANEIGPMANCPNSIINFINKNHPYVDAYDLDGTKYAKVQIELEKWIPLPVDLPKITVFPNPSTGIFEIQFEEKNNTIISIEVYNLEGRLLYDEIPSKDNYSVDLSDLNVGIYLLKVQTIVNEIAFNLTERIIVSK